MRDMNAIDPLIFQPFGAGPRICIGMRFALMEVKMLICDLLLNFRIAPSDDTPVSLCALHETLAWQWKIANHINLTFEKVCLSVVCF